MDAGEVTGLVAVLSTLIGLPWVVFHYITKWKTAATLTRQDEDLLDDLHDLARRLDDRVVTIERIMDAETPGWRIGSPSTRSTASQSHQRLTESGK